MTRDRLSQLFADTDRVAVVHYSCSTLDAEDRAIWHIVVKRLDTNVVMTFDGLAGERSALDDFAAFIRQHPETVWLHWNMRSVQYGFEAIAARHRQLGGTPAVPEHRFDLAAVLPILYGADYIGHPRLPNLISLNELTNPGDLMDWQQERDAIAAGQPKQALRSVHRKVESIEWIARLAQAGRLRTANTGEQPEPGETASVNLLLDDNAQRILAIAGETSRPTDERMRDIVLLDRAWLGKSSGDWSELLRVSPQAIRKTPTWREMQGKKAFD